MSRRQEDSDIKSKDKFISVTKFVEGDKTYELFYNPKEREAAKAYKKVEVKA